MMIKRLSARLTYANVMATVAVFLAIGGGVTLAAIGGSGRVKFGGEKGLTLFTYETVLSLPGVGKIQASCSKGTNIRFKNKSGKTLRATVHRSSTGDFESDTLANNESLEHFAGIPDPDTLRFQVFRTSGSGKPAADITVGSRYGGGACEQRMVTAQAVSSE